MNVRSSASSLATDADRRLAQLVVGLLPRLGRLMSDALRSAAGPSAVRVRLLSALAHKGPTRAGELATFCATTPSGVTELIESLEADGHVRRGPDPTDRRVVVISLTEHGRAELVRAEALVTAAVTRALDRLTPEQRARLVAALADLNEILASTSQAHHKENANVH